MPVVSRQEAAGVFPTKPKPPTENLAADPVAGGLHELEEHSADSSFFGDLGEALAERQVSPPQPPPPTDTLPNSVPPTGAQEDRVGHVRQTPKAAPKAPPPAPVQRQSAADFSSKVAKKLIVEQKPQAEHSPHPPPAPPQPVGSRSAPPGPTSAGRPQPPQQSAPSNFAPEDGRSPLAPSHTPERLPDSEPESPTKKPQQSSSEVAADGSAATGDQLLGPASPDGSVNLLRVAAEAAQTQGSENEQPAVSRASSSRPMPTEDLFVLVSDGALGWLPLS